MVWYVEVVCFLTLLAQGEREREDGDGHGLHLAVNTKCFFVTGCATNAICVPLQQQYIYTTAVNVEAVLVRSSNKVFAPLHVHDDVTPQRRTKGCPKVLAGGAGDDGVLDGSKRKNIDVLVWGSTHDDCCVPCTSYHILLRLYSCIHICIITIHIIHACIAVQP